MLNKLVKLIFAKDLAKVNRGLTEVRSVLPFKQPQPKIDPKWLVSQYESWVYGASSMIGQRVATPALRLYATQGSADDTIRAPHKRLSHSETKSLLSSRAKNTRIRTSEVVVEVTEHPFIELWNTINSYRNTSEFLNESTQFGEVTGDFYWYIERGATGLPVALHLLPSQFVVVVPGSGNQWVKTYLFGTGPAEQRVQFSPDEIMHYRLPNLANAYVGKGRAEASQAAIRLSEEAKAYNIALNENMGQPATIISLVDPLASQEQANKFKNQYDKIMRGNLKQGKTFAHTGEIKVNVLGQAIRDMQFVEGQVLTRDEIMFMFGVPKSLYETEGVNKGNGSDGLYSFELFKIKAILNNIADGINSQIIPMYGDDSLFVAFDENVPENEEFELEKTKSLYGGNVIDQDEARAREGYGPAEPGQTFILQGGIAMGGDNTEDEDANFDNVNDEPEEEEA